MSGLEPIMIGLALAGSAATATGTILSAQGQKDALDYEAKQGEILAEWQARNLQKKAEQDEAAGAVRAREKRRESELVQSEIQAKAAASGAGAVTPTVLNLIEGAAGRGEYLAQTELAAGKMDAADRRHQADTIITDASMTGTINRLRGKQGVAGSYLTAAGQAASGVADTYARYK